jgi:hypothetical protein
MALEHHQEAEVNLASRCVRFLIADHSPNWVLKPDYQ